MIEHLGWSLQRSHTANPLPWQGWEAALSMFGHHPPPHHTHIHTNISPLICSYKSLPSPNLISQRVWPDSNLYHLQHGGKPLKLTSDTPVHWCWKAYTPSSPPTFTPSFPHREAKADVSFVFLFPLVFHTDLCFYFLLSVEPNAALPPSLPLFSISLQCYSTLLSPHRACHQLAGRGKKGGNTYWMVYPPSLVGQLMPCVHSENKQMLTEIQAAFLPFLLSGSPPPCLCLCRSWLQPHGFSCSSFSSSLLLPPPPVAAALTNLLLSGCCFFPFFSLLSSSQPIPSLLLFHVWCSLFTNQRKRLDSTSLFVSLLLKMLQ